MAKWWQEAVVYQVYPRSFKDSNGDGIGDLNGIISKVEYFAALGVTAVWLGPIFSSPNDDCGYDVSDYRNIMTEFGTMEDFDRLLEVYHKHNIKVILDLVVNHTSDEHKWYVEAKKGKDNPYRDYYIWRKGKNGKEPTNWESVFSGSTWNYDEKSDEYALHLYSKKQMDLNWENEKVRKEVYDLSRFWLDKGIDGFRLDTITTISKNPDYPDAEIVNKDSEYQPATQYYLNGPRLMEFLHEFKDEVFSRYDIVTIGETPGVTTQQALEYVDMEKGVMDVAIQWEHIEKDPGSGEKWGEEFWTPKYYKSIITKWQNTLMGKGWNVLYTSNHDQPRQVSRFGNDSKYWKESAKMLATCIHMQRGTPFIYQGEEIGMTNVAFDSISDYRCVETRGKYAVEKAKGTPEEEIMAMLHRKSRDNARTPMQWNENKYAGFSDSAPWIGVNPNYVSINVEQQEKDPDSILNYYRKLTKLRRDYPVVVNGDFETLLPDDENLFIYKRKYEEETLLVLNNFSEKECEYHLEEEGYQLLLSNYQDSPTDFRNGMLRPYEACVYYKRS